MNRLGAFALRAVEALAAGTRRALAANMWRLLTVAAIVFSSGISGAALAGYMHAPLPAWWGWFGAALAGVAVYGGVTLVLDGERIGFLILAFGAAAEIALSAAYFGEGHTLLLALILGAYPSAVAILSGLVESRRARHAEAKAEREERRLEAQRRRDEDRRYEREQQRLDREAEREAQRRRDELRLELELARLSGHDRTVATPPAVTGQWPDSGRTNGHAPATLADVAAWLTARPDGGQSVTGAQLAAEFGLSERTARRWLERLRNGELAAQNGHAR